MKGIGRAALRPWVVLSGIVAGSSTLLSLGTSRVHEWAVMTDELLYAKLARHVADSGSPVPTLHGKHVGFLGVVYPIVLAPFYGWLNAVDAFDATHIVNAVLFAGAAIPAYLLARRVAPTACALVVAALCVAIPWSVGAAFVMSEAAAYPVFLWAVLSCHVALSEPSVRRDLLAIGGLALAYFTRPQFAFLAAVLPLAAVLTYGPRGALAKHRVLAGAYALGILAIVPLAALGESHRLLGDYGVTATHGSLLPSGVWKSAALHLDVLAVGLGVVPFLLGAAWTYSNLRTASPPVRAFAALAALTIPLLALEAASYDVRFGGEDVIRDRYVFYLAPLLLLATALCLFEARLPLLGIGAATVFFAATVSLADFKPVPGIWVDSPESVLNGVIHDNSGGLGAGVFVAICGVLLGVICLALGWVPRPAVVLGVTVAVFAFTAGTAGYAFDRLLTSLTPGNVPVTGQERVRNWVDRGTSGSVAVLAYPVSRDWGQSAVVWWEVEFWNHSVTQAFVGPNGNFTYTPFPSHTLALDFDTGRFPDTAGAPEYVLTAPQDSRFALDGRVAAANAGLTLLLAERPYRALWATRGLDVDGFTKPNRPATVRVYAQPGQSSRRLRVTVAVDSPPEATAPVTWWLDQVRGSISPGTQSGLQTEICVPAGGHTDLQLVGGKTATILGPPLGPEPSPPRAVGPVLSAVQLEPLGTC